VQINYQLIVDAILEPALEMDIPEHAKFIITDYIRSLSKPSFSNEVTDDQGEIIMAVGKNEKELLLHFWEDHKRLIVSAFRALSEDSRLDENSRRLAAEVSRIREAGAQNHTPSFEVQRFMRKVFNHYAINTLSEEPTNQDKDRRTSEIKEEHRKKFDISEIRLTSRKGQGLNIWFGRTNGNERVDDPDVYVSGDYRGNIPNDPMVSQKDEASFGKYPHKRQSVEYWNNHFEEFIKAFEAGILIENKRVETGVKQAKNRVSG
ncbi:MAG: hypothetical protein LBG07_01260, partial [Treponema sp.]|nr:hypothetical protein [Treponema sp.]